MVALDTPAWRTWNSKGVSSTLSSGAHTSISSSTLNPVGLGTACDLQHLTHLLGRVLQVRVHHTGVLARAREQLHTRRHSRREATVALCPFPAHQEDAAVLFCETPYHLRRFVRRVIHEDHPVIQVRKALAQLMHEHRDILGLVAGRHYQGKEYHLLAPPTFRPASNRLLLCFHGRSRLAYWVDPP